ncbi:MAG TPA: Imm53 family immunity protein, partial [Nannocystis sp.]
MTDVMRRLQTWYASMCDGDWEHRFGVRITTLDNPGWHVRIDILETGLEIDEFVAVRVDRSDE